MDRIKTSRVKELQLAEIHADKKHEIMIQTAIGNIVDDLIADAVYDFIKTFKGAKDGFIPQDEIRQVVEVMEVLDAVRDFNYSELALIKRLTTPELYKLALVFRDLYKNSDYSVLVRNYWKSYVMHEFDSYSNKFGIAHLTFEMHEGINDDVVEYYSATSKEDAENEARQEEILIED